MNTKTIAVFLAALLLGAGGCSSAETTRNQAPPPAKQTKREDPRKVVERVFPECFANVIGASSGLKCEYDAAKKEWHITAWHGWGDCPAGCINTEIDARYLVDKDGRIFGASDDFKPGPQLPSDAVVVPKKVSNGPDAPRADLPE